MSDFPPSLPTSIQNVINAYVYEQFQDDDDVQALFQAHNDLAQQYLDWFNVTPLAVYTDPNISGELLDWTVEGIYGLQRPYLPSGNSQIEGPYNTCPFDTIAFNRLRSRALGVTGGIGQFAIGVTPIGGNPAGPPPYYATNDDVFRRVLTWHFYKGDGKVFAVDWLKRRIMRFLFGANGLSPVIDNTYPVSVTFGPYPQVNINIAPYRRSIIGGALFNRLGFSRKRYNELDTHLTVFPSLPLAPIFKAAMDTGVLEFPFQYQANVVI